MRPESWLLPLYLFILGRAIEAASDQLPTQPNSQRSPRAVPMTQLLEAAAEADSDVIWYC